MLKRLIFASILVSGIYSINAEQLDPDATMKKCMNNGGVGADCQKWSAEVKQVGQQIVNVAKAQDAQSVKSN